jgi:hypothetical protein
MIAQKYRITWTQQTALATPVNRGLGQQMSNIDELFEVLFTEVRRLSQQVAALEADGGGGGDTGHGYWTVLTDGDPDETDLIFANGEAIALFVPLP